MTSQATAGNPPETKDQRRLGIGLSLIANAVWGGAAFYWLETQPASPIDVLAHRAVWTLPAVFLVLVVVRRVGSTFQLIKDFKTLRWMMLAAFLISINWGTFLYAVTSGHATEASLGYFLLPILSVLLGMLVFKEVPSPPQRVAIAMALLAIVIQLVAVGGIPVISLGLSLSFAIYAVIRKRVAADAIQGLFIESMFLLPAGALWLFLHDGAGLGQHGLKVDLFLLGAGAFTALPLLTSVAASRLLPMSTVGLLSYVGPSIQLIVAQFFLGESISPLTLSAFVLVWMGLVFIVIDNIRSFRRLRKVAPEKV